MNNGDDPERRVGSEAEAVLYEVGRQLYYQCMEYATRFPSRPIHPLHPEDPTYDNELLIQFQKAPGETVDYQSLTKSDCSITFREGYEGWVQFEINKQADPEVEDPQPGDITDTYLFDSAGQIVATERLAILRDWEVIRLPIEINPEHFSHEIAYDFKAGDDEEDVDSETAED